jgi:hypothetical protein
MTRARYPSGPFYTSRLRGWPMIALYIYCLFLTTVAAALAATIATAPYWIPTLVN